MEAEDEDDEADAANEAEGHAALAGAVEEGNQNDDQLRPEVKTEHVNSRSQVVRTLLIVSILLPLGG